MTTEKLQKDAGPAVATSPAVAVAPVVHAEPKKGGSYTRNLVTGELERSSPQVADQIQE